MRTTTKGLSKRKMTKTMQAFYETPWVIEPSKLGQIIEVLESRANRRDLDLKIAEIQSASDEPRARMDVVNGVAVIGMDGILSKRMNLITEFSGGTSTEVLTSLIQTAAKQRQNIVLDVDSPGGAANGMHEPVQAIKAARANGLRVVAVVNESTNSGAYWIASAAERIVTLPTGSAGSIGAFTVHQAKDEEGVKVTVVRSPKDSLKAAKFLPLTEEVEEDMQRQVDQVFNLFASVVAENRNMTVQQITDLKARVFMGQEAIDVGLVDRIGTLEEVIDELGTRRTSASVPASAVKAFIPMGV